MIFFSGSSCSQDGTSSGASTSEINLEENNYNGGIYEKFQVIDELLLNDQWTEYNNESHMMLKEIYEEYFQLVSKNSLSF